MAAARRQHNGSCHSHTLIDTLFQPSSVFAISLPERACGHLCERGRVSVRVIAPTSAADLCYRAHHTPAQISRACFSHENRCPRLGRPADQGRPMALMHTVGNQDMLSNCCITCQRALCSPSGLFVLSRNYREHRETDFHPPSNRVRAIEMARSLLIPINNNHLGRSRRWPRGLVVLGLAAQCPAAAGTASERPEAVRSTPRRSLLLLAANILALLIPGPVEYVRPCRGHTLCWHSQPVKLPLSVKTG